MIGNGIRGTLAALRCNHTLIGLVAKAGPVETPGQLLGFGVNQFITTLTKREGVGKAAEIAVGVFT